MENRWIVDNENGMSRFSVLLLGFIRVTHPSSHSHSQVSRAEILEVLEARDAMMRSTTRFEFRLLLSVHGKLHDCTDNNDIEGYFFNDQPLKRQAGRGARTAGRQRQTQKVRNAFAFECINE